MGNRKLWIWFIGLMTVYFITRYLRQTEPALLEFFKYHFTDLLFIPTVSVLGLIFVRYFKRDNSLLISPWLIAFLVLTMSFYFEWYLPTYKNNVHPYTSDRMDVLMYVFGGIGFYFLQKRA